MLEISNSYNYLQKVSVLQEIKLNISLFVHKIFSKGDFSYTEAPKHLDILSLSHCSTSINIYFWVPSQSPGARIAVWNAIDHFRAKSKELQLDWSFKVSSKLPQDKCNVLICYKAIPPPVHFKGTPIKVLLLCDQLECFWNSLHVFDEIVVHSSRPLAELIAKRHRCVWFIEECEDVHEVAWGKQNLETQKPSERGALLVWHGHRHTIEGLLALRKPLEKFARHREIKLRVISNCPAKSERWGNLQVEFLTYDAHSFHTQVGAAKIGLVPARNHRPKHCYFKPSSRLRRLYALGVVGIGEQYCPMVKEFVRKLPRSVVYPPLASSSKEWLEILEHYWRNPVELDNLAMCGHRLVEQEYMVSMYTKQWIFYLSGVLIRKAR